MACKWRLPGGDTAKSIAEVKKKLAKGGYATSLLFRQPTIIVTKRCDKSGGIFPKDERECYITRKKRGKGSRIVCKERFS
jgi:hypothetical protein